MALLCHVQKFVFRFISRDLLLAHYVCPIKHISVCSMEHIFMCYMKHMIKCFQCIICILGIGKYAETYGSKEQSVIIFKYDLVFCEQIFPFLMLLYMHIAAQGTQNSVSESKNLIITFYDLHPYFSPYFLV